jgi:hypothetical protein
MAMDVIAIAISVSLLAVSVRLIWLFPQRVQRSYQQLLAESRRKVVRKEEASVKVASVKASSVNAARDLQSLTEALWHGYEVPAWALSATAGEAIDDESLLKWYQAAFSEEYQTELADLTRKIDEMVLGSVREAERPKQRQVHTYALFNEKLQRLSASRQLGDWTVDSNRHRSRGSRRAPAIGSVALQLASGDQECMA